jgi:poly-gamma-glutamate capsule biosynthesis protein CapA/YwtB (metallophosphatase superfamily)
MGLKGKINGKVLISILLSCLTLSGPAQSTVPERQKISLFFIGDIMGHDEQIWSAENRETHTYNYDEVFSLIRPVISETGIAIANFEVTLAGTPYKGYPQFSSPPALADACRKAGIDYLVTANNHSADRGRAGIEGTIHRLDSLGIPHTGTFISRTSKNALQPLIIKKDGFSIALLNYTYGTNGIKVPEPVIVNMLVKDSVTVDIEKAKASKPDLIVLFLHWGTEYDTIPSKEQADLAHYFFSKGVDLVIGSHPHVLQKMVWYKNDSPEGNRAVIYSLGNFVTNQRKPKTDGGAMVRIELTRVNGSVRITDAGYYLTWVYTPIVRYRKKFFILPCTVYENKPEFFTNPSDYDQMKKFINDSRELLNKQNINIHEIGVNANTSLLNY